MTAFRRAVVGFDGSEPAGDALALAQRLTDPDGELLLACVDAQRGFRMPHARKHARAEDVLAAGLAEVGDGVRVRGIARSSASAARGLTEIAEEERADLLVVGAHHETVPSRPTPGATALRLLHGAPCAVAIAPRGLREHDRFHHVGVAYDASPEAEAALAAAYTLAARDGAAMSIYFAVPVLGLLDAGRIGSDAEASARSRRDLVHDQLAAAADAAPAGVNPRTVVVRGEPATEIPRESDGVVDVLFTGSRGYGPVQRVMLGSVAEALLLAATQPVVVVARASLAAAQSGAPTAEPR
jgi:nucleotide-binding universal stress UspA family protein